MRFGAITPQGESLLLSEPMLEELAGMPCWLDGAVRVRLESRRADNQHPWLDALARPDRPPLVEAMAVYFDPDTSPEEVMAFQAMAGVLTPAKCPTELFLLTRSGRRGGRCKHAVDPRAAASDLPSEGSSHAPAWSLRFAQDDSTAARHPLRHFRNSSVR